MRLGALAQLGERRLCKAEVAGSIPARSIGRVAGTAPNWAKTRQVSTFAAELQRNASSRLPTQSSWLKMPLISSTLLTIGAVANWSRNRFP